jgi:hypothetical protein
MAKVRKAENYAQAGVFSSVATAFNEEEALSFAKKASELGYNPHEITQKIIEFGLALTGLPLYDYQIEAAYRIIYAVISFEAETLTMLWARQSGKTETLTFVIGTLTVILPALAKILPAMVEWQNGFNVGLFAPQADQVSTTYNRVMQRMGSPNAHLIMSDSDISTHNTLEARYILSNGSPLTGQTASIRSKIESKTYHLALIEEAQDCADLIVQKSIEPMLTATGGTVVKVGTTGTHKGDFWYEISRNQQRSKGLKDARLKYHFQYDYKEVIRQKRIQFNKDGRRFHLNYELFISKQIEKRGTSADTFRLAYALQWNLEQGMFMSDAEWKNITNRRVGFAEEVEDNWDVVAGLDIAKSPASTVLTIVRVLPQTDMDELEHRPLKQVLCFVELKNVAYDLQHETIVGYLNHYNVRRLVADYTGVGKPVLDHIVAEVGEYIDVIPYNFTRQSKSDMWIALQRDIETKRLTIPANAAARETDEFLNCEEQMKNLRKWYVGSYLCAEKSDGYFDDYCDSLGLSIVAANTTTLQEESYEIEILDYNPFTGRGSQASYKDKTW